MSVINLCVSQRWVSEKLSVESLRDLELFGGEVQGKPKTKQKKTLFTHWCVYQHKQKTTFSSSLNFSFGNIHPVNHCVLGPIASLFLITDFLQ